MHTKTLAELSRLLHRKECSSVELTQHFLNRIQHHDPLLNSFITVCEEQALHEARHADTLFAHGQAHTLTGIPIAQKDNFCTQGVRTSCGSKMLDNFISPYNATTVDSFKKAGSVLIGKTNMDEFAMGGSTEKSYYGPTRNPWRHDAVPGGSSGGSAVAVAAGLAAAATGTDTGGSIRQPAAFCGITGLKPTYGAVSRYGMVAYASSLDQGGPMTKTAEDAAIMMNIMGGHDPKDSTSVNREKPDYTATLNNSLKGLTIGLPKEYFDTSLSHDMATIVEKAKIEFEKLGATCVEISLPHSQYSTSVYYIIAPAEASSNLARFDGVRYGHRCNNPENLNDLYQRSRAEGFGDEVKRRILIGTYALSSELFDAYYVKAQKVRRLVQQDLQDAFRTVDLILTPTTAGPAFDIGATKNPIDMYLSDLYTIPVNLAGLPAISIPAGFINQLPAGIQLIGNYFAESLILNAAHQYQQVTNWHNHIAEGYSS